MLAGSFCQECWFNIMFAQQAKLQLGQKDLAILALLWWFFYQLQK